MKVYTLIVCRKHYNGQFYVVNQVRYVCIQFKNIASISTWNVMPNYENKGDGLMKLPTYLPCCV